MAKPGTDVREDMDTVLANTLGGLSVNFGFNRARQAVTDALEATRIADEDPRLCAPLPETYFERAPKAFYLPADAAWHGRLDAWLDARRADGTLAHVLKAHGVTVTPEEPPRR